MPERIQQILNRIVEWWKNFSTRQKALIISIAAVVARGIFHLGICHDKTDHGQSDHL